MKRNDLIALIFALVLLVGVGYFFLNQNKSPTATASTGKEVEVAPVIPSDIDPDGTITKMSKTYKVQDYKQPLNLTGLGNSAPFGN
jgi:hypothetical protein